MKRLLLLILLAVAAWYGWTHRHDFLGGRGTHEAVIENESGRAIERLRLTVGSQSFARESIADGQKAVIPFRRTDEDATFSLVWSHDDGGERTWSGGQVSRGPLLQRHVMRVDGDDAVIYRAEGK